VNPVPGRQAEPLTLDTAESSKTGRTVKETAADLTEMLDDGTSRESAPTAKETPPAAPSPGLPDLPAELQEVRRQYGELGVQQVLAEAHREHLAAEHEKLAKAIDGWGDPETRAAIVQEIRTFAASQGYSEADLDAVVDSRAVILAYNALQRGKELAAPRPPAATSRPAVDARQQARAEREARLQEAYERAAKTHRLRDAGDTFAALLIEKPE